YFIKIIIDQPWLIFDCLNKSLRSLFFLARNRSSRIEGETIPFPQEWRRLRRKGQLRGPFAYIQSRLDCGWTRKGLTLVQASADATSIKSVASSNKSQEFLVERVRK